MAEIKLGGKTYKLVFGMDEWEQIEDEICGLDELGDKLAGKGRLRAIARLLRILSGRPPEDDETVWKELKPGMIRSATKAIWAAIEAGMQMETSEDNPDAEVDVTLEEIKKNGTPDS